MPRPFPHQAAWILANPLRALLLSPRRLAERLPLAPGSRVLEVGSGPGFYSVEIARRLGRGYLCLLDLQPEMLAKARRRVERRGMTNTGSICAAAGAPPFAAGVLMERSSWPC